MKKTWNKKLGTKSELIEALYELLFYVLVIALALVAILLIPKSCDTLNIPSEILVDAILIAFAVILSIMFHVFIGRRKIKKLRFQTFSALKDEIQKTTDNHSYLFNGIRITYKNTLLEIEDTLSEKHCMCTLTHEDGTKVAQSFVFDEVYQVVLDFLHDECLIPQEIKISDDSITKIEGDCLYYKDCFDRVHTVDLHDCAKEYNKADSSNPECIGERNPIEYSYKIYTPIVETTIIFYIKNLKNKKKFLFTGTRDKRFEDFQAFLYSKNYYFIDIN